MTEQPAKPRPKPCPPKPQERRRSMVGFYVGMGVILALFVGGWFAWTPG